MFALRLKILMALMTLGALGIVCRLWQLQVMNGERYGQEIVRRSRDVSLVSGPRAPILDRQERPLARDLPSFDLSVAVKALPLTVVSLQEIESLRKPEVKAEEREAAFRALQQRLQQDPWVLGLSLHSGSSPESIAEGVLKALDNVARRWVYPFTPQTIVTGIDQERWVALRVRHEDQFNDGLLSKVIGVEAQRPDYRSPGALLPGLSCTYSGRRFYLEGVSCAHLLGTLGTLEPKLLSTLKDREILIDRLEEREQIWAEIRSRLQSATESQLNKLTRLLQAAPQEFSDVEQLLTRLREIPAQQREQLAHWGLKDPLRWSTLPPLLTLNEPEKIWMHTRGEDRLLGFAALHRRSTLPDLRVGETGLERFYNERLRGKGGFAVKVNRQETPYDTDPTRYRPEEGEALRLTIDLDWQRACEQALAQQSSPGAMVLMDAYNGEILALASYPNFDPNLFSPPRDGQERQERLRALLSDEKHPLRNRVLGERYPLGSVMKPFVAAVALELGKVRPAEIFSCSGYLQEGNRRFHCDGRRAHGNVTLTQAIRRSCNVCFFELGARIGVDAMAPFAEAIGLGRRTGIDLPGEVPGIYPDGFWRKNHLRARWSRADDFQLAIGQGYMNATPLQATCMMATLANGGRPISPKLNRNAPSEPQAASIFSPGTLQIVCKGMEEVVSVGTPGAMGTAYRAFHDGEKLGIMVAGKTGTADVEQTDRRPHAWFSGYIVQGNARYAFSVLIENGGHGGEVAAPVAYRAFKAIFGTRSSPTIRQ